MSLKELKDITAPSEGEMLEIAGGPGSVPAEAEKADTEVGPPM